MKNQLFVILGLFFSEPNSGPKPTQIPTANTESTFLNLIDTDFLPLILTTLTILTFVCS